MDSVRSLAIKLFETSEHYTLLAIPFFLLAGALMVTPGFVTDSMGIALLIPATRRWVIRRKAEVVAAVRGGLLSLDDALAKYRLTAEEFLAWQKAIDKWGMQGLRTTRIQSYRS